MLKNSISSYLLVIFETRFISGPNEELPFSIIRVNLLDIKNKWAFLRTGAATSAAAADLEDHLIQLLRFGTPLMDLGTIILSILNALSLCSVYLNISFQEIGS